MWKLDEVSFRSVERGHGIVWLRYLAVVRRGSFGVAGAICRIELQPLVKVAGETSKETVKFLSATKPNLLLKSFTCPHVSPNPLL